VRVVAEGGQEDSWGRRLQTKKKNNRGKGAMAWFRSGEKIRFRFFFCGCPKFLSLKKNCPL
jgi:hypothetical protein